MILNDYKCPKHGEFEGSHPICPAMGCDSEGVVKIFKKAPGVKSDSTKRFDEGLKKSADMYRQTDWKSAKDGESAKAHNRAAELKWGGEAAELLGKSPGEAVGGQAGTAKPAQRTDAFPTSLVSGTNPISRAERTGVKKQDDAWKGQLSATVQESRARLIAEAKQQAAAKK
ncbi:MAG TPA: hypothetical protein VMU47_10970 [Caldimonas sp.]|nr:hypothetical protein [Caldimonas sp.]